MFGERGQLYNGWGGKGARPHRLSACCALQMEAPETRRTGNGRKHTKCRRWRSVASLISVAVLITVERGGTFGAVDDAVVGGSVRKTEQSQFPARKRRFVVRWLRAGAGQGELARWLLRRKCGGASEVAAGVLNSSHYTNWNGVVNKGCDHGCQMVADSRMDRGNVRGGPVGLDGRCVCRATPRRCRRGGERGAQPPF